MSGPAPALVAQGLTRSYRGPGGAGNRVALDDVSLSVAKGELFALLGPNGGGKTTLFRILSTLLPPDSGRFEIAGIDAAADPRGVRRRLGVVFQSPSLDRELTVEENLVLHGELHGLSRGESLARRRELVSRFGLEGRERDRVGGLSGGLARRVEIAKALLPGPEVLLLDEPSTGLDPIARRSLRETLRSLSDGGTTVLLTTHLFDEADGADRIAILDRGRLVAEGTPAALKSAVGGDVLVLETSGEGEAAELAALVGARFGGEAGAVTTLGEKVRIERRDGHRFLPTLVEAFPGRFRSAAFGAPTLEDVFIDRTGHAFEEGRT